MANEFTDLSGKYGDGPRCPICHNGFHDEESGPYCDLLKMEIRAKEAEAKLERIRAILAE